MSQSGKVRENRLRRAARRQGYKLRKSRTRDPRALDYGGFWLIDVNTNHVEVGGDHGVTIEEIEQVLWEIG